MTARTLKTINAVCKSPLRDSLIEAKAKATMCGRCGTKHVPPSSGGTCPALKEGVVEAKEADYGGEYQNTVKRVGEKAKQGKMKTVWVADKYGTGGRYKVVPAETKPPVKEQQKVQMKSKHNLLKQRDPAMKQAGTDESVGYASRFMDLLAQHGYNQKLVEWHGTVVEKNEYTDTIQKNISTRKVSTDSDTDVIRDYDTDDLKKQQAVKINKHHHHKVKTFRTYMEGIEEAISSRMALSKAADMEYKAANTDDPSAEQNFKGKAKALKRAARLAQSIAGTVNVDVSKLAR